MASVPKPAQTQNIPIRMVGTPSRTAAMTLLLLLIGCGLGLAGFLYNKNDGNFFARIIVATASVPPFPQTYADLEPLPSPPSGIPSSSSEITTYSSVQELSTPGESPEPPTYRQLSENSQPVSLPDIPINGLFEKTAVGNLPIVAADGRRSWQEYARPFLLPRQTLPVGVVVRNLGLNRPGSEAAIRRLPPEVTLSFHHAASNLEGWVKLARSYGHEVMIEVPMEPEPTESRIDLGPKELLASLPFSENKLRLEQMMAQTTGYIGLFAPQRTLFSASPQMAEFLTVLEQRGLMFVGDTTGAGNSLGSEIFPVVGVDSAINAYQHRDALRTAFNSVFDYAVQNRQMVIVSLEATPVGLEQLTEWIHRVDVDPSLALAPISTVARIRGIVTRQQSTASNSVR